MGNFGRGWNGARAFHDARARYTEHGDAYADNMQRLLRKFETAKDLVPRPVRHNADQVRRHLLRLERLRGANSPYSVLLSRNISI
jgi:hypothetical protein